MVYPQPAPQPYRPLENRLVAVKVVFWLIAGIYVASIVSGLFELPLASRWADGENVPASDYAARDHRVVLLTWVQRLGGIAGAMAFITWLHRAYKNVDAIAPGQRRHGYGWAIGGWFVPILNLWRPKQIINDVWRAGGHPLEPPFLLLAWWLLWIGGWIFERVASNRYGAAATPEDYRTAILIYVVSDAITALTAILAILVAARLTQRLNDRAGAYAPGDAHDQHGPVGQ